jgi:hypothetical protein
MNTRHPVWLASYPRSGNTLLRTILWHCFSLQSASIYRNDLGGNQALEAYVGHLEQGANNSVNFPENSIPLIKTHGLPQAAAPAIYIVRDGRAASASLWHFYNGEMALQDVIAGRHRFGTWCNHIEAWQPWSRPSTLLLKYEDLTAELPEALKQISHFLQREIINTVIPDREIISETDGRWVRKESQWQAVFTDEHLQQFNEINGAMMRKLGYTH